MKKLILLAIGIFFISNSFLNARKVEELINISASYEGKDSSGDHYAKFDIEMKEGWHIYWKNPGSTGLPTEVYFNDTNNIKIKNIIQPIPSRYTSGGLTDYVHHDKIEILVIFSIKDRIPEKINGEVSFLICKDRCLPGNKKFSLSIDNDSISDKSIAVLNDAPSRLHNVKARAAKENEEIEIEIDLSIEDINKLNELDAFPEQHGYYDASHIPEFKFIENKLRFEFKLDSYRMEDPKTLSFILVSKNEKLYKDSKVLRFEIPIFTY